MGGLQQNTADMSGQNCDLFCFAECGDRYNTLILKREDNIEKLSLKKKTPFHRPNPQTYPNFSKNNSSHELQRLKCSTDRSREPPFPPCELALFRRKMEIEQQLQSMNQEISHLNEQYLSKMRKLRSIKQELGRVLHQ